jgi:NADH-quinone oxidoreductase subunit H
MGEFWIGLFHLLVFPGPVLMVISGMVFHWIDRRTVAILQRRVGPPWYQPLADVLKLLSKEDILPRGANEQACTILPIASLASVLAAGLYIPVGVYAFNSFEGDLVFVLFLLSIPGFAYFLAGWASTGVFGVLGGNRALLQFFAYEVPFLMALVGPAIASGSWSIATISAHQAGSVWTAILQPVGFMVALVGLIGKLKRPPFDIPKAKSELIAGPLTEFSGRKLALWHLTIHTMTVVGIFLLVSVFLGTETDQPVLIGWVSYALKSLAILFLLSTITALYARFRIDQLANLGWWLLVPLGLLQLLVVIWMGAG